MTTVPPNGAIPPSEDPTVSARLAEASAQYEALPASVATRLDRALDDLPPLEAPHTPAPVPGRRPWWRRGWVLAGATSGVAAVFAGVLFFAMSPTMVEAPTNAGADVQQQDQEERAASEEDEKVPAPGGVDDSEGTFGTDEAGYQVTYSGHDYTADDLTHVLSAEVGAVEEIDPVLGPIASDPGKLDNCATAAGARFGGTVTAVDFGTFDGAPAVIVVVSEGDGEGTIVAQRPACADVGYDAYHAVGYGG